MQEPHGTLSRAATAFILRHLSRHCLNASKQEIGIVNCQTQCTVYFYMYFVYCVLEYFRSRRIEETLTLQQRVYHKQIKRRHLRLLRSSFLSCKLLS